MIKMLDDADYMPMAEMVLKGGRGRAEDSQETVRTYFPETWIWDLVPVG